MSLQRELMGRMPTVHFLREKWDFVCLRFTVGSVVGVGSLGMVVHVK